MGKVIYEILDKQKRMKYYDFHANYQKRQGWHPLKEEQYNVLENKMSSDENVYCNGIDKNVNLNYYILDSFYQTKNELDRIGTPKFVMDASIGEEKIASMEFEPRAVGICLDGCHIDGKYLDTHNKKIGIADLLCERMERLSQEMGINSVFFTGLQTGDLGSIEKSTFENRRYIYEPEDEFGECLATKVLPPINTKNIDEKSM